MDREKDKQKLLDIQTDLANYIYKNYRIYTVDEEKDNQLNIEYNRGEGNLTLEEFLEKSNELKEYSDIEKIEFTGFSVGPMKGLDVSFTLNGVYKDMTTLDTKLAETDEWIYTFNSGNTRNGYVLEKRQEPTTVPLPEDAVVYYGGGVK